MTNLTPKALLGTLATICVLLALGCGGAPEERTEGALDQPTMYGGSSDDLVMPPRSTSELSYVPTPIPGTSPQKLIPVIVEPKTIYQPEYRTYQIPQAQYRAIEIHRPELIVVERPITYQVVQPQISRVQEVRVNPPPAFEQAPERVQSYPSPGYVPTNGYSDSTVYQYQSQARTPRYPTPNRSSSTGVYSTTPSIEALSNPPGLPTVTVPDYGYSPSLVVPGYVAPKSSDVYVRGYVRKDGTYVQPHMRSAPNGTVTDNFTFKGNINPYTGKRGSKR